MSGKDRKTNRGTIVIRREEVVEGGHHGGAWKVAYADFVTAMMAFFLVTAQVASDTSRQPEFRDQRLRVGAQGCQQVPTLFSRG